MTSGNHVDLIGSAIKLNKFFNSVFAVVKWVKDNNLFSTVKLSTISLPPKTSQPVLDQIYPVYFDKAFHDGQVKFIGEHGECKLKEKIILGHNSTSSPKP